MSEEWGPWIEHDGRGCPCAGRVVEGERRSGVVETWVAGTLNVGGHGSMWVWGTCVPKFRDLEVVRYRIRKPRGLTILEGLLENLPERVPA